MLTGLCCLQIVCRRAALTLGVPAVVLWSPCTARKLRTASRCSGAGTSFTRCFRQYACAPHLRHHHSVHHVYSQSVVMNFAAGFETTESGPLTLCDSVSVLTCLSYALARLRAAPVTGTMGWRRAWPRQPKAFSSTSSASSSATPCCVSCKRSAQCSRGQSKPGPKRERALTNGFRVPMSL